MESIIIHLQANRGRYFVLLAAIISIIAISVGTSAVERQKFNDPLLAIVPLSNVIWILLAIFDKSPTGRERHEGIKEALEKHFRRGPIKRFVLTASCLGLFFFFFGILITSFAVTLLVALAGFAAEFGHIFH